MVLVPYLFVSFKNRVFSSLLNFANINATAKESTLDIEEAVSICKPSA
jgi:hypothetical protein